MSVSEFKSGVMAAISELRAQQDIPYPQALEACMEVMTQYAKICVAGMITMEDIERLKAQARVEARDAIIARLSADK